jgi:MFS transporter, SP family, galactose:H+ symporter
MFAIGLLPAAALAIGMLRSPETPAWLEAHGRSDEAREVILQVADDEAADRMLRDQRRSREEQTRQRGVRWLMRSHARPAVIIGAMLRRHSSSPASTRSSPTRRASWRGPG